MKALVVEEPGKVVVKDVTEPALGDYEARTENLYGATCTGTDLHVIDDKFAWKYTYAYPNIIGHETVGRVTAVGKKVRNYKVGDLVARVYTRPTDGITLAWGGMSQYGLAVDWQAMWADGIDKAQWDGYRVNKVIPEGVIDEIGATMIITWRENLSWINRMGVKPGEKMIVIGSGANGISIAACAWCKGAEVTVVGNTSRKEQTLKTGVQAFVDYKDADAVSALIAENKGQVDYIVDATGKSGTLNPYMETLKLDGMAAVYGMNDFNTYTINPIKGPARFRFFNSYAGVYDEPETHEEVIDLIRAGKLDARNWIDYDHVFTWENAPEAYEFVRAKKAAKVVIKLSE